MKTNRITKFVVAIIIPAVLLSSVFVNNARAMSDSGKATVINKSMIQAFIKCYDDYFKDELSSINDWTGIGSIKNSTSFTSWNNDDKPLPTDFTTINDDDLRCSEVIEGYHPGIGSQDIYGIFDRTGHSIPSATDKTGAASWLVDYAGYRQGNVANNAVCVRFNFHHGSTPDQSDLLSTICADGVDSDGRIVGNVYAGKDGFEQHFDELTHVCNDAVGVFSGGKGDFIKTDQLYLFILNGVHCGQDDSWQRIGYTELQEGGEGLSIKRKWEDFLIDVRDSLADNDLLTYSRTYSLDTTQYYIPTSSESAANYTKDGNSKYRAAYGLLGLSGPNTQDDVSRAAALTSNEQIELYREYLASFFNATIDCNPLPGATGTDIKWFENGSTALKTCKINSSRTGGTVNGLDSNRWFVKGTTYQNIIDFFNGLPDDTTLDAPASTVDPSSPITPVDPTPYDPSNPDNPETTDVNCYTNAGAIGWILCPITESGGKFVQEIYDKFIEPQLVLDSGLFNRDNQGGEQTYEAWQTFRNLANIAFVAVFLFVIFSQLTGFGIDNYGIKKILPKMIVAAIIVNVSYFICQIAIDLANIVGYGIKNIMATVGTVPESSQFAIYESGHTLSAIKADLGIAALVGALVVPAVLGQGVGILISVFTAVIGIVIAILTLFVVLAARKTLSLVLVVISPLAFLCYMLPNTKKLFNKWLDALKGTLLAFPICAGMVFGGQAVSRIVMLSSSNVNGTPFFMTLIAAATAVAPIFLIPSVLKKSMGAISGIIDRASHGVNRFAKGRWQGSRAAKNMKTSGERWANRRASGLKFDKDGNVVGLTRSGARRQKMYELTGNKAALRRMAVEQEAVATEEASNGAMASRAGDIGYMKNVQAGKYAAADKQRVSNIESSILNGENATDTGALGDELLRKITSNDKDSILAHTNVLTSKGEAGQQEVSRALNEAFVALKKAQDEGNTELAATISSGIQNFSQNVMTNHQSVYKTKDRSVYDTAKFAQNEAGVKKAMAQMAAADGSVDTGRMINTEKLSGDQMIGMNDYAMDSRYFTKNAAGEITGTTGNVDPNVQAAAYAALHSNGIQNVEAGRRKRLEMLAKDYTPPASTEPQSSNQPQSDPFHDKYGPFRPGGNYNT